MNLHLTEFRIQGILRTHGEVKVIYEDYYIFRLITKIHKVSIV